jgi:hypothetical protein
MNILLFDSSLGINEVSISLVELYTEHNQKMEELIGKGFTAAILERHETTMKHVVDFMQFKFNRDDILLKEITSEFIREFEHSDLLTWRFILF